MKRATVTIPDDLVKAIEDYARTQEVRPPLTAIVQVALREYLKERGYLPARRALRIRTSSRGSGRHDVSEEHDRYFAESSE